MSSRRDHIADQNVRGSSSPTAFFTTMSVYAICYLLVRLARDNFLLPEDSSILFELDWMPDHVPLVQAFADLYGIAPNPPSTD